MQEVRGAPWSSHTCVWDVGNLANIGPLNHAYFLSFVGPSRALVVPVGPWGPPWALVGPPWALVGPPWAVLLALPGVPGQLYKFALNL